MLKRIAMGLVVATVLCITGFAQEDGSVKLGVGVKVGTPGAGIEIGMPFTEKIGGRLGFNYFTYDYDTTQEGVDYKADLTLLTVAGLIDWHPTGGSFRVSGGVLYNGNEVTGKGDFSATDSIKIGDNYYTGAEIGKLEAKVDFDDIAPYIGIGWDTSFGAEKQWGFICDLGLIYHGAPHVDLKSKGGTKSSDPGFLEDLRKEKKEIEDNIDDFVIYPVATFGLLYRF